MKMTFTDMLGRTLQPDFPPQRIVSLFPSQTFLLASLGLDEEVVGLTRFCKYPEGWKKRKRVVGGTKDFRQDRIEALKPDLILANKEENTKEGIEALAEKFPVYVSDVVSWDDNLRFTEDIGRLTGRIDKASEILEQMEAKRKKIAELTGEKRRVAYFIWKDPWMLAGKNTFIDTMLSLNGWENIARSDEPRYPAIDIEEVKKRRPQLILLASEPYPFKEKHRGFFEQNFPGVRVLNVPGEPFTWFGSYPLKGFDYFEKFQKIINDAY